MLRLQALKPRLRRMLLSLRPSELPAYAVGPDGRYVLESEFARGSSGILYRARDVRLDRTVALKQLFSHRSGEADVLLRFRQQAHVLARLAHPNIIHVYDFIEEAKTFWIAMELVEGESLETRLARGALPVEEAVRMGSVMAEALAYAHKTGVIHRDFRPANVLIDGRDRLKIRDFAIAGPLRPEGEPQSAAAPGAAAWMSPEQADAGEVDARSDVYALGATLYLMVTGAMPFKGDPDAVFARVQSENPPAPRRINRSVPKALDALVLRMMAKKPDERPQSMAEVKAALDEMA